MPITIAMLGFNAIQAIAISNSTIFCGAIVRYFFFSIHQKNPKLESRTMIDYNIVSIMMPNVLIGAYSGIMLQNFLPETLSPMLLFLVIVYATYETFQKGIKLWKAETIANSKPEATELKPINATKTSSIREGLI